MNIILHEHIIYVVFITESDKNHQHLVGTVICSQQLGL